MQGKLRCNACKEVLSKKESTIKKHIKSNKREKAKKAISGGKSWKISQLQSFLKQMTQRRILKEKAHHRKCEFIDLILLKIVLAAGVPLARLGRFLEKYGHRITSHSHLSEMIPAVLAKEKETMKSKL